MKITVVEPRDTGGMIHYAYHLCTALADAGAEVTLLTGPEYELDAYPHNFAVSRTWRPAAPQRSAGGGGSVPKPLRIARRAWGQGRAMGRMCGEWLRQVRRLRRERPDWVLFGSIEYFFEAPFLAMLRRGGIRLASIVHEPEARDGRERLIRRIDHAMFKHVHAQFDALFVHNRVNHDRLLGLYPSVPERIVHVIEHGNNLLLPPDGPAQVDLRARYGFPADSPVVLFFGTMLPSKGIEDLIDAFGLVAQRHPEARLLVTGYASKKIDPDAFVRRAEALGIAGRVAVAAGYVPLEEVEPLMRLATVVAFPYRSATQSGAMQVAYAFGRPVVATRVGGLPEVVEEGRSGYTVPPQDPPALAEALGALLDDPDGARRMGEYAKHLSETKHSWSHVAGALLEAFGAPGPAVADTAAAR